MGDTFAERMKENNRRRSGAERSSPPERKEERNTQTTWCRSRTDRRSRYDIRGRFSADYEMPSLHLSITPLAVRASKANRELNSIRCAMQSFRSLARGKCKRYRSKEHSNLLLLLPAPVRYSLDLDFPSRPGAPATTKARGEHCMIGTTFSRAFRFHLPGGNSWGTHF